MPPRRRYGLAGPQGIHESPSPCPVAYGWAVPPPSLSYALAENRALIPRSRGHPGRANTLLAIVLVPAQPPADTWPTEWPGEG
jgi:hypothetical protein